MEERLKKRLVGATVLVSLVVIFVPMLLEDKSAPGGGINKTNIPPRPEFVQPSRVLPLDDEPLAQPPAPSVVVPATVPIVAIHPEPVADKREPAKTPESASDEAVEPVSEPTRRVGLSAWVIQVASYGTKGKADKLIADLRKKGFAAFLEQAHVKKQDVYRVRVGPELNRKRAEKMRARLKKEVKLEGLIVHYP